MREKTVTLTEIIRLAVIDIFLIAIAYMLPVLAHRAAFPLYWFDPMRLVVLAGLILSALSVIILCIIISYVYSAL